MPPNAQEAIAPGPRERFWVRIIAIVSILICAAVAFLFWGPRPQGTRGTLDVSGLPHLNAALNALCALLLCVGYVLVRWRRLVAHRRVMLAAFATSVAYHWFQAEPRRYAGAFGGIYLLVLLSHIALSALIVPMALLTLYRGWSGSIARHRKIARITLPIWLYVSLGGVVVYAMLYLP